MSSADSLAGGASSECPKCGSDNIELDSVQALTFCLDCGFVLANEQLDISVAFGEDGERSGVRVSGNDDGTGAAIGGLAAGARGAKRAGFKASQAKAAARVRALCGSMCLPPGVQADALGLSEHLLAKLYGRGDLRIGNYEKLAAAVVYIAARLAQLPLTAVDVALTIRIPTKAFGRVFCSAVAALGLALPVTPPHVFLRAAAHKLCRSKAVQANVERDATKLEAWLSVQQQGSPLVKCAAALCIALEAHEAKAKNVSKVLHVSDKHLKTCVYNVKLSLVQAAQALPWAASITTRNVALHLETILKITRLTQQASGSNAGA